MTLLRVTGLNRKSDAEEATLILQDVTGCLALAFVIPMNEADRLARVLGVAACRYAPVFELLLDLVGRGGLAVTRTVLHGDDQGIAAVLVIERNGTPIEVACHPADAVALAVRTGSPIYANGSAMEHACRLGEAHDHPSPTAPSDAESSAVARWLDQVRPADFGSEATP